ncbi:MAG TPA: acyl-CoA dehydrogenase family protein [Hyalangium sp.]|nr:acyl-CoA dehydrogenase family protein [Hyalangium sp.]
MTPQLASASSTEPVDTLEAVRALAPRIREVSAAIERERRLPAWVVQALKDVGVIRMTMPRAWGGPELEPLRQLEVVEELSRADSAVGWCAMIGSDGGYYSAFLEDLAGRQLYRDLDAVTAGLLSPAGRADVVPGGYRVSGRWSFGSGCQHSELLVGGVIVFDEDSARLDDTGAPEWRIAYLPRERCEILDTWHTLGLRGTGSHDYVATDLFVPAEHTFSFQQPPRREGPLYALPGMFMCNMPGVPLGIARAALEYVTALAAEKLMEPGMHPMRAEPRVQAAMAQASAIVGSARAYMVDTLGELWRTLCAGDPPSQRQRATYRLAVLHAFRASRDAVQIMYDTVGGSAFYTRSPLERHLRDVQTASQHITAQLKTYEPVGRMLLGLEPGMSLF